MKYAYLDIETTSFSLGDPKFVLGCGIDKGIETRLDTVAEMLEWYLGVDSDTPVYAHNGGRFDFLLLLSALTPYLDDKGLQIDGVISGSALACVRMPGHAELRDSYKLFPASLAKLTGRKTEFPLACRCGRSCGGYCATSYPMTKADKDQLYHYCRNDTIIMAETVEDTIEALQSAGIRVIAKNGLPRLTAASVAVATSFAMAGEPQRPISLDEYRQTMRAYYGGRVECYHVGEPDLGELHCYDVKSLYPAMGSAPLPTGEPTKVGSQFEALDAFDTRQEGMYLVRAYSKPQKAAPLPRREGDRVVYATGDVFGWYCLPELIGALPFLSDLEIRLAYIYEEMRDFSSFYATAFAMKDKAEREGRVGHREAYKLIANSDTGKRCQRMGGYSLHRTNGDVQEGDWLTSHAEYTIRPREEKRPPWCARPIQGAYITGRARALMLPHLMSSDVVYSDTDSLMRKNEMPSGNTLGEFVDEGSIVGFRCVGPKAYMGIKNGAPSYKIKGVTLGDAKGANSPEQKREIQEHNLRQWERYRDGVGASFPGLAGVRTAIKNSLEHGGALLQARTIVRANRADPRLCGTRLRCGDGSTVSLHYERGVYSWPGADVTPRELLTWLPRQQTPRDAP